MQSIEIRCKKCGKKLLTYSQSSIRRYKSPVKNCKRCGTRYADPRCHEIAIEGILEDVFNIPSYVIMVIIGALVLYRGIYLSGMHQLGISDEMQWLLPWFFTAAGAVMMIIGAVEIIAIKSGRKAVKYKKLKEESEARLNDKNYAYILQSLGYMVPEKYL